MRNKFLLIAVILIAFLATFISLGFHKRLIPRKIPTIAEAQNKPPLSKEGQRVKNEIASKPIQKIGNFAVVNQQSAYQVGYGPTADAFFVSFAQNDIENYDKYNQEIENWFVANGIKGDDLCKLSVIYAISANLRLINFKEQLPSCQV